MREETAEYKIPFTQFIRPNGDTRTQWVARSGELADKAQAIIRNGLRFEAEVLTTGEVSLTVHDRKTGEDVAIEVCSNGPPVVDAIDRLISRAYTQLEATP